MQLELQLKPFTGKIYHYSTSNVNGDVRADVSLRGFWVHGQLKLSYIR